jgi:hypothetical protein
MWLSHLLNQLCISGNWRPGYSIFPVSQDILHSRFVISQPSPQVRKVFDIVKAVPLNSIFSSTAELDEYLDHMQRKVSEDL